MAKRPKASDSVPAEEAEASAVVSPDAADDAFPSERSLRNVDPKSRPKTKAAIAKYLLAKADKVLELAEFATVRQIAAQMQELGWSGVSRANVGKILKAHLDEAKKQN